MKETEKEWEKWGTRFGKNVKKVAKEQSGDSAAAAAWANFNKDIEKVDWEKVKDNPKYPGPFQFKLLFKSDLDNCTYSNTTLDHAEDAPENAARLSTDVHAYTVTFWMMAQLATFLFAYASVSACYFGYKGPEVRYEIVNP